MAIKHWNGRCAKDGCASRDTVVQRSKKNKQQYGDEVFGWAIYRCNDQ